MIKMPETKLGRWSVGLNAFFLLAMITGCVLVLGLKVSSFDNHWWDVTAAVAFPASLVAFVLGIIAVAKFRENSVLVKLSIAVGALFILFLLTHSLYIHD